MKTALFYACLILCALQSFGADTPVEINLLDGSRIKGRVVSTSVSEVTVMSDIGLLRIALDKLTPESRGSIAQTTKPDTEALLRHIAELEAKITQLQQENENLRKQALSTPAPTAPSAGSQSMSPSGPPVPGAANGLQYSLSSAGKRHNSGCRFFASGKACTQNEGVPCKICGG